MEWGESVEKLGSNAVWAKSLVRDLARVSVRQAGPESETLEATKCLTRGLHVAVFVEPFLGLVLQGEKRLESRFSRTRCAPYERVSEGDIVLLKASGGPVVGAAEVESVSYHRLDQSSLDVLREQHAVDLCAESEEFWAARANARFASILGIGAVARLPRSLSCDKRDRRGWVCIRQSKRTGSTV